MTISAKSRAAAFITLHESIAALRRAWHVVEEARDRPGVYRIDDRPDRAAGDVVEMAHRLELIGWPRGEKTTR